MKCPDCGKQLNKESTCQTCVETRPPRHDDIEIEYKEFSVAEFLEIRKKPSSDSQADTQKPHEKKEKKSYVSYMRDKRRGEKITLALVVMLILICMLVMFFYITAFRH